MKEKNYTVYDDEIVIKITPEMIRLLMKATHKDSKYATTTHAESFIELFRDEIEDSLRDAVRGVVNRHYE
jgi:hypothetical protein|tara:strand:- start:235 stop:444 length:210 start_codon:yes stop_codon:yes gene_type:complete